MSQKKRIPFLRTVLTSLCVLSCWAPGGAAPSLYVAFSTTEDYHVGALAVADQEVAQTDLAGGWALTLTTMTARLPRGSAIDALDYRNPSRVWFSLDIDVVLDEVLYADEDVIFWDGSTFSLGWDGSTHGLPRAADLDALHVIRESSPLEFCFSLDVDAGLSPLGLIADEDLVLFREGEGLVAVVFDGSAHGVSVSADLDAVAVVSDSEWLLSFDVAGGIGSLAFDDADLVSWNPKTGAFQPTPVFSAAGLGLPAAIDLSAARVIGAEPPTVFVIF